MMGIDRTYSVCPSCFSTIPAEIIREGSNVYMYKTCQICRRSWKTKIWRDVPPLTYENVLRISQIRHLNPTTDCPHSCGLCDFHKQKTCLAVVEVTRACSSNCIFCYANAGSGLHVPWKDIENSLYLASQHSEIVQISGGEPTVRSDIHKIVKFAKEIGFRRVELNSNGIALSRELAARLKEEGLDVLYLSLDSLNKDITEKICGKDVLEAKLNAIENCERVELDVIITMRIIPGMNSEEIGRIIEFGLENSHVVKGVHLLPVTFSGRVAESVSRITLPEVLQLVENQTNRRIKIRNFIPSLSKSCELCPDIFCSMLAVVNEKGKPLTIFDVKTGVAKISRQSCSCKCEERLSKVFTVSIMPFQDAWNLDLRRVALCCIHVAVGNRLIPQCIYNLSALNGRTLYRNAV